MQTSYQDQVLCVEGLSADLLKMENPHWLVWAMDYIISSLARAGSMCIPAKVSPPPPPNYPDDYSSNSNNWRAVAFTTLV